MERKPNIILINCDDLGYGDLGCYGSTQNKTPNIDKMAENGTRFTDFYMAAPVCSASRAAMLTGCYPLRVGFQGVLFPGQDTGLHQNELCMARMFKHEDYATMIIGKWHCGDQPEFLPTNHGFDHYYGIPYSNDMGRQVNRDSDWRCPLPLMKDMEVIQQQPDLAGITERYTQRAVEFVRDNHDRPFFLYFAHMYVHLPHYAPDSFIKQSENGDFGAVMACLDWSVGALNAELARLGLAEDTMIVFTSDNGGRATHGGSNGPLRGAKGSTWEGGQRVPCIMYQPGKIPAGATRGELACSLDLYKTFASMLDTDFDLSKANDSLDIGELIFSKTPARSPRDTVFYFRGGRSLEAARFGDYKLKIADGESECELLFNLCEDIGEQKNLYGKHPEIVERLKKLMDEARLDLGDDRLGITGTNVRPAGKVENPVKLTEYDEDYPYIIAMYDKEDAG
jgi:arylsulfatase A-like enzyme